MKTDALLDLLRSADPLGRRTGTPDLTEAHLAASRAVLRTRTSLGDPPTFAATGTARPVNWRRRLITLAAAVTALPVVAAVVVPAVTHSPRVAGPLLGVATAGDGGLSCGEGYARAIRPDHATSRPYPTILPTGWNVREILARQEDSTGWCATPSLTAATLDADNRIAGSISIIGPTRGIRTDSAQRSTPDRVGSYAAERLDLFAVNGGTPSPAAGASTAARGQADARGRYSWIITDDAGEQWYAVADGYELQQARALLSAASYSHRAVTWDSAAAPGLRVLHQRTGAPYPIHSTGQSWYVELDTPGGQRSLQADIGRPDGTVGARANRGSRLTTIAGRPALVFEQPDGQPSAVYTELRPGVLMFMDVHGDLNDVQALLATVNDLPADDPRLDARP